MSDTTPSRAELERLMEAARDARSAELRAGFARLLARLRVSLRPAGAGGHTRAA
jgi:hypothetical protein